MEPLSLFDLNVLVRRSLAQCLPDTYWVKAELSDVRSNSTGHCYLEFVQKDPRGHGLIAKARGMIWNNVYRLLKPYFEETTGQPFAAGIQVLVQVSVDFHELYGYSLTVCDIDPAYTLGELALRRQEILRQLKSEGVLTLNKELPLPALPQRIAVISSATAAGYGDFSHQLIHNPYGFYFHTELFPALMQGDRVEASILHAFEQILQRSSEFDVVVIIRGGGATSDLSGFDTYLLAAACAQFPLPVITGIGHERDDTVLDVVSHTRVKTPTAAAEFLIAQVGASAATLQQLALRLQQGVQMLLEQEQRRLQSWKTRIPTLAVKHLTGGKLQLASLRHSLEQGSRQLIFAQQHRLELLQQRVADASPDKLLARGYSITLCHGQVVKTADQLQTGDVLVTRFQHGSITSQVTKNQSKKTDNPYGT